MRFRFIAVLATSLAIAQPASAQILWSNGYGNWQGGQVNQDYLTSNAWAARSYDNFRLTSQSLVTGFFGYFNPSNGFAADWTAATWEVRTGLSSGNLGTLIASGSGAVNRVASEGRFYSELTGLNLQLDAGDYWLFFAPQTTYDGYAVFSNYVSNNANAVNAVQDNYNMWAFSNGAPEDGGQKYDLAIGAFGQMNVVPEPASIALVGAGLGVLGVIARRRRTQA